MSTTEIIATVLSVVLVAAGIVAVVVMIHREYKRMRYLFLTPEEKLAYDAAADARQELKDAQAAQADAEQGLKKK